MSDDDHNDPESPSALRRRAASLMRICAETPDTELKGILSRLAGTYLDRARAIEAATAGGGDGPAAGRSAQGAARGL